MEPGRAIPLLPARDLDEALAFYAGLGFATSFVQHEPDRYAILVHGGLELHLFGMPEVDSATNYAGCYLRVPDADALHRRITAALPTVAPPQDRPWGMREFHLVDPSGNLLRIGHRVRTGSA